MTIHSAPLNKIAQDLRNGNRDLSEYITQVCDRIDAVEPNVKALVPETNRRDRLEQEAAKRDAIPPTDRPPLFGIPVAVKDILHVDGFLTKANSDVPPEVITGPEADAVTALRNAGALILGKAVTAEFAVVHPGPTRNPHNLNHTPGGSSSGSAAAVAAGMCPLALGSQTGGSTIRPAAYCGVVGFKPSFDRVSTAGMLPVSESADHVGVFTQNTPSMRLAASELCCDWDNSIEPDAKPVLGVPEGPYLAHAEDEGIARFNDQLNSLENAGYTIRRIPMLEDIAEIYDQHASLLYGEIALSDHHDWFEKHGDRYSSELTEWIRNGRDTSVGDLAFARSRGIDLRNEIADTMADHGVDLLVSPAATGPAPEGLESTGDPAMNMPWTYAGVPAITVPAGRADNDLPLGFQCIAPFMQDERLLAWSQDIANKFDSRELSG